MRGGHDAARDAETSSGAPDAIASDEHSDGTADTVAGALSPGSTATASPTSTGEPTPEAV